MKYTVNCNNMSLDVNKTGAEISSLKISGKEYIWQGNPKFWAGHGPLLFPIVGRVENDKINIGGKECHLTAHGFLRNMDFILENQTENSLTLSTKYTENTLRNYPYRFKITAKYKISQNQLDASYIITNLDDKIMPYGFGLHNGFYCLDSAEDKIENVYLEFDRPVTINKPSRDHDSFMDFNHRIPVIKDSKILNLQDDWYPVGPPVADDIKFRSFKLCHKQRGVILEYSFSEGFELFNAWRANKSPFICLEPWSSQAGVYPCAKSLEEIKNTKYLKPSESRTYSVTVKF